MTRRPRPRLALVVTGVASVAALAAAWAGWLARRPRPDLNAFVPAGARLVVELRGAKQCFARLQALDRDGALLGSRGVITTGLRRLIGPAGRADVLGEIGRDEALAASFPRGRWLVVFRPGAREAVADRVAATLGLVGVPGNLRTIRLADGTRLAYALRPGVALLAGDPEMLRAALARRPPAVDPPAPPAAFTPHVRARWLRTRGPVDGAELRLRATPDGLRLRVTARLRDDAVAPGPVTPPGRLRLDRLPSGLAAMDLAAPDVLDVLIPRQAGRARDAVVAALRRAGLDRAADRWPAIRPVAVWLGVDRRGIVPMPQVAVVWPGAADLLDADLVARLDARLRAESRDRLRLEPAPPGWAVNFPVTRTLAPALAPAYDAAVVATSAAALETTVAGWIGSGRGDPPPTLLALPAHAGLRLDLAGLAVEARLTIAGLREYGLLAATAERRWEDQGASLAAALQALGRLDAIVRWQDGLLILDAQTTPAPSAELPLMARAD